MDKLYFFTDNKLQPVPCSKSEVFKSKVISKKQKGDAGCAALCTCLSKPTFGHVLWAAFCMSIYCVKKRESEDMVFSDILYVPVLGVSIVSLHVCVHDCVFLCIVGRRGFMYNTVHVQDFVQAPGFSSE